MKNCKDCSWNKERKHKHCRECIREITNRSIVEKSGNIRPSSWSWKHYQVL